MNIILLYVQILFKRKIVHIKTLSTALFIEFNTGLVQISRNIVVCVCVCMDLFSVVCGGTVILTHN